jgi:hypothetical protein
MMNEISPLLNLQFTSDQNYYIPSHPDPVHHSFPPPPNFHLQNDIGINQIQMMRDEIGLGAPKNYEQRSI